jgi:hypothetical protein
MNEFILHMVTLIQESRTLENHNIAKEKKSWPHTGRKLRIVVGFAISDLQSEQSTLVTTLEES